MSAPLYRLAVSSAPVATVSDRYLCFCVDLGQVAEPTRFWNPLGAAGKTLEIHGFPPYDFGRLKLRRMASALAPAYLRIGGTEADRAFYQLNYSQVVKPPVPFTSVLSAHRVDEIGSFARAVGFEVIFTVNAGWGTRTKHGRWVSDQARALMSHVRAHSHPFTVFELGNEPNAWPFLQRNLFVQPEQLAVDLLALSAARDDVLPTARVAAPATAFFPAIGEVPCPSIHTGPPALLWDYQRRFLAASNRLVPPDILTWHYYPGQSTRAIDLRNWRRVTLVTLATTAAALGGAMYVRRRGVAARGGGVDSDTSKRAGRGVLTLLLLLLLLLPAGLVLCATALAHVVVTPVTLQSITSAAVLDRVRVWGEQVQAHALEVSDARRPVVWLGETGSAQAGGQDGVSGRWAGALWWMDQLGTVATLGQRVQCRQTLSGSDYGLIDEVTLTPTPDYWATVLWRRLMGSSVYAATAEGAPETVRIYCHCDARIDDSTAEGDSKAAEQQHGDASRPSYQMCLALNLGDSEAVLTLPPPTEVPRVPVLYVETWVLTAPTLDAQEVHINGVIPQLLADGSVPELPPAIALRGVLALPPSSATFFHRMKPVAGKWTEPVVPKFHAGFVKTRGKAES